MPRTVLLGLLIFLGAITAAVASYLVPQSPLAVQADSARPAAALDPSVIVGPPKVRLAVLVVFDQMRGDYIPRWKPAFPPGGFRRLMDEGCWFPNCMYPYATTTTGPGHAALMTGATQDKTGIINNEWYDRVAGKQVYCATSDRHETIGGSGPTVARTFKPDSSPKKPKAGSGTPERLVAPSLGDSVKDAGRGSKVIGLSMKDRAAIFPSGHKADAAYWFNGSFVTSSFYRDLLPAWVRQFNSSRYADQWYGTTWERLRPDLDYVALAGPDNVPGEASRGGPPVFPHRIDGGKPTLTASYYEALSSCPAGNDLLLAFAKTCIDAEELGQRSVENELGEREYFSDLLTISFSANDYIGHAYGPDSQEVLDITLRSDRTMADLLSFLDQRVGEGNYTLVVSADHGICPLPEVMAHGGPMAARPANQAGPATARDDAERAAAKRVALKPIRDAAEKMLHKAYGIPSGNSSKSAPEENNPKGDATKWIEALADPWLYLNERQIERFKQKKPQVAEKLADWLRKQPDIARVYTARDLERKPTAKSDEIERLVRASYYPGRGGDLYILLKPYCLSDKFPQGTTHGTPYDYDRWVPLLVFGPGLPKGEQTEPAQPQQTAAILADALGVKPPRDAKYPLPKSFVK